MKLTIDRILMITLILGLWALVFKPTTPSAHSGQICEIVEFEGWGEGTGEGDGDAGDGYAYVDVVVDVYIYEGSGKVICN